MEVGFVRGNPLSNYFFRIRPASIPHKAYFVGRLKRIDFVKITIKMFMIDTQKRQQYYQTNIYWSAENVKYG